MNIKSHTLTALCAIACAAIASAQVPSLINYQGRLTDANGDPVTGSKNFAISIYDAATGGTLLYTEDIGAVTLDDNGVYSFQFGSSGTSSITSALSSGAEHWMAVSVDGTVQGTRQRVLAVPFAMKAAGLTSDAVATVQSSMIANGAVGGSQLGEGAAISNLRASGLGAVASGGVVLSVGENSSLVEQGYVRIGQTQFNDELWNNKNSDSVATSRAVHTAVWTGTEMIVWGGTSTSSNSTLLNTGYIYNPSTNTWRPTSTLNAPSPRNFHAAVWTGSEMIVWGGWLGSSAARDGGRYNPVTNTWSPLNTNDAPSARDRHVCVWTGSEMIVWGRSSDSKAYNPSTDSWRSVTSVGAPSIRRDARAVWTGTHMLVWGGFDSDGFSSTGGCYDPVNDAWSAMSTINAPTGRNGHSMIWSGSEMIVWGGSNVVHSGGVSSNYFNDGGRYNPLTNSWTSISLTNAPATREAHTAVWTGSKMIIYGGFAVTHRADGKSYDPENNTWSSITTTNQPPARSSHAAVWTGGEMIIFGGFNSTWATLNETYTYMPPKLIFLYQRP